jgi:hypothetical protein
VRHGAKDAKGTVLSLGGHSFHDVLKWNPKLELSARVFEIAWHDADDRENMII